MKTAARLSQFRAELLSGGCGTDLVDALVLEAGKAELFHGRLVEVDEPEVPLDISEIKQR